MSKKSFFIGIALAAVLALPAQADWTLYKNSDLAQTGCYGWSIKVPDTWTQLADVKPAWPQGAGYAAPGGKTYVLISKAARPTETEQTQLTQRGYTKNQRAVKTYQMLEFTKTSDGISERLLYLTTPRGEYRLTLCCSPEEEATIDQVLKSFTFINDPNAKPASAWTQASAPDKSFTISYPHDCQLAMEDKGFTVTRQGKVLMHGYLHENSNPPAQSFRGMARQLCSQFQPGANPPAKFTPYEVGKVTAYEAMGQRQDGSYYGPLVYVPLSGSKWKVLECYLEDQEAATEFFRIVNTIKTAGQQ